MTIQEFYKELKKKDYPGPKNDILLQLVETTKTNMTDPDKEYFLKIQLESDRRNVFKYWYGSGVPDRDNGIDKYQWQVKLRQADEDYRAGMIGTTIDFILTKETIMEQEAKN